MTYLYKEVQLTGSHLAGVFIYPAAVAVIEQSTGVVIDTGFQVRVRFA